MLNVLEKQNMVNKLTAVDWVAVVLVIVGGLNWGLVGLFSFDLVAAIFGMTIISKIVYILVALAAIYLAIMSGKLARK